MFKNISIRNYLFGFLGFIVVGRGVAAGLLYDDWPVTLLITSIFLLFAFIIASVVSAYTHKLIRTLKANQESGADQNVEQLLAYAPRELKQVAHGVQGLMRREAEAKQELEERVAERTSELSFSRDLLFQQNIELESRSAELAALYEISQAAITSTNIEEIHRVALRHACKLFNLPLSLSIMFDSNDDWHGLAASDPEFEKVWKQQVIKRGEPSFSFEVFDSRQPLVIEDSTLPEYEGRTRMRLTRFQSVVFIPMISPVTGKVFCILTLGDRKPRKWQQDELKLMQTLANQLSLATSRTMLVYNLEVEHNRLEAVLSNVNEGVIIADNNNRTLLVNRAARRNLNLPADTALVGKGVDEFGSITTAKALEIIARLEKGETVRPLEITSGDRILSVSVSPIYDRKGTLIGVTRVQRDVTEETMVDRMKTEFISLVSHELRTPLTSIKGYLELVLEGDSGQINEMQQRFLGIAKTSTDRLVNLINDLLDVSRIESGKIKLEPTLLCLKPLLDNLLDTYRLSFENKKQEVILDIEPDLPPAWADPDRVNQILTNLLSNAVKYTPPEGKVNVHLSASPDRQKLLVAVSDTGIGLSEAERANLFTKFFRSSNPQVRTISGTGLGLVITKSLVELSGGDIEVKSTPGQGSTFSFTLPCVNLQAPPALVEILPGNKTAEIRRPGPAQGRKILVVDGERHIAELLRRHLEREGYYVNIAGSGEEALRRASLEHPDLITLDIIMPGFSGLEVLKQLKAGEDTHHIPVVIISIMPEEQEALRLGALAYFTKPIREREIIAKIGELLDCTGQSQPVLTDLEPLMSFGEEESTVRRARVLVIDDDATVRGGLDNGLRESGYTSLLADNGLKGLELARRYAPDLILLDLNLPGLDGLQVLQSLKRDFATNQTPVIILAGLELEKEGRRVLTNLGASGFLEKHASLAELALVLGHFAPPVINKSAVA